MTSSTANKYTTTEYGKQNMFAAEAQPWIDEKDTNYDHWAVAEQTNGRLANFHGGSGFFHFHQCDGIIFFPHKTLQN